MPAEKYFFVNGAEVSNNAIGYDKMPSDDILRRRNSAKQSSLVESTNLTSGIRMRKVMASLMVIFCSSVVCVSAHSSETQYHRTMSDKGKYFLLDAQEKAGIITTIHKRIGVSEVSYSKTEINCKTNQYRDMGYGEEGPDRIKLFTGKWTDAYSGSSKSDLLNFVCTHKRS